MCFHSPIPLFSASLQLLCFLGLFGLAFYVFQFKIDGGLSLASERRSVRRGVEGRRRSLISYFWITALSSLAADYGVKNVKEILDLQGFLPIETFGYPFMFFVTLLRFTIGNLLHIRRLEKANVSSYIWLFDFTMIFIESLILILLGCYCYENILKFLILLMALCLLDCLWILSIGFMYLKGLRSEVPWAWGLLNLASGLFLANIIFHILPLDFRSFLGSLVIIGWFTICAIIDLFLVDYYKLLKE